MPRSDTPPRLRWKVDEGRRVALGGGAHWQIIRPAASRRSRAPVRIAKAQRMERVATRSVMPTTKNISAKPAPSRIQSSQGSTAPMKIVDQEAIARRAYERYLQRGGQHGNDQEDWFAAERELTSGGTQKQY
jgi:hypothetical protein